MITIKKIAELSGVSRGTVDRVLNNRGNVKSEVAQRVIKIADSLGYKPNLIGKALAGSKTPKKIGIILNSINNPFFDDIKAGIKHCEEELSDFGFRIMLRETNGYNIKEQEELISLLENEKINALAITPIDSLEISNSLNRLIGNNIPVITINTNISNVKPLAYVGCDYYKSGEVAAGLLGIAALEQKVNVYIVTGSRLILGHNLRINGFIDCLKRDFLNINVINITENNDDDILSYQIVKKILLENRDINALFFTAAGTIGGLKAIEEIGRKNLKVITYDLNSTIIKGLNENIVLATIVQDPFNQGYLAVKTLFDYLIANKKPVDNIIQTELNIKIKYNL